VEVEEGVDGLVHVSDMSWTKRIKHPSEVLNKGDEVTAVILKIDSENQRLSLGIKQLQPNEAEDFFREEIVGSVVTGKVVRTTDFGAFVELHEGVEGLVHVSEMSKDRVERPEDVVAVGQEVRVKIIKVDPAERKIGLSMKAAAQEAESESLRAYNESQGSSLGSATFGDLASAALLRRTPDGPEVDSDDTAPASPDGSPSTDAGDGSID